MGHAVCFADDDIEEVVFRLAAQIVARLADGLGIGADICERRAELVGDIGGKFLAALLGWSREYQADYRAVVGRVDADIAG